MLETVSRRKDARMALAGPLGAPVKMFLLPFQIGAGAVERERLRRNDAAKMEEKLGRELPSLPREAERSAAVYRQKFGGADYTVLRKAGVAVLFSLLPQ